MHLRTAMFASIAALALSSEALADEPFVVLSDDGTIEDHPLQTGNDLAQIESALLERYEASGQPLPEVMSVWTTFPFGGSNGGTYFDPLKNDVTGIGLESAFGGDGTFDAGVPPLRCILFHNNVMRVAQAAEQHRAPVEGYAEYLFLLELSHLWGPAIKVPAPAPNTLIGFPFHWSFFMSAGGSPAGGNPWVDHGDGTFSVTPSVPAEIKFSPLDLYLMGLAPPEDVPPFFVIEEAVVPDAPTDPLWGGKVAPHTFPWFSADEPLTVSGVRRDLTVDDVVDANGARSPAPGVKTSYTLGVVLITGKDDTPAYVEAAKEALRPIASNLAPRFADATSNLGSLELVTNVAEEPTGAGGGGGEGGAGASSTSGGGAIANTGATATSGGGGDASGAGGSAPGSGDGASDDGGCAVRPGATPPAGALTVLAGLAAAALWRRRR